MLKSSIFWATRLLGGLALLLAPMVAAAQLPETPAPALLRDEEPWPSPLASALVRGRALRLDLAQARALLAEAPPEGTSTARPLIVRLPLPDGRNSRFAVWRAPVMAPALAARYPQIQTYAGRSLDEAATVRLDLTPQGFHAQVLSAASGTSYIEPARRGDNAHYVSFFKRNIRPGALAKSGCGFRPTSATESRRSTHAPKKSTNTPATAARTSVAGGALLRTYRLALAATAEYTAFHGGTKPLALAAMVTTLNRVVGVYETELAVRLQLVARTDTLIYTNAVTDPYTNTDGEAMLTENQATADALIGPANYDIGHVFSTDGGGVAGYAVVCNDRLKAMGVTGSAAPVADAFDIDFVCHEMGHQFSGSHTFNGTTGSCDGNRMGDAAREPGAGSTIMSYAGLCTGQNLQPQCDPFFHAGSYEEMRAFILATACAVATPTGNTPPSVAIPPARTLPVGTPFNLTAFGTDPDGDSLTYSWEQIDLGSAGAPTAAQVANDHMPLFRSWVPNASPTRYFPRLADLVNNTTAVGERLPTVTRRLTFKCTARDQHRGPAGVSSGVTSSDSLTLDVTSAAGPFVLTSPNTALTWAGGSQQVVAWDVAGTTGNGVNCATVNVRLSTDGGFTYPTMLARGVPNAGTATLTVPQAATTTARLLVEAADNYFFDISDTNFTISSPAPCAPPTNLVVSNIGNTSATLRFTPATGGTQYTVSTTPATATQTVAAGLVTLSGLLPGVAYTVQVASSCGGGISPMATAAFTTTAPMPCGAPSELAVINRGTTSAVLSFGTAGTTSTYTISTTPATTTQTVPAGPVTLTGLTPATTYTVRVVGNCAGGATATPSTLAFRTLSPPPGNDGCANALPLVCGSRVVGTTDGATATGDPTATCTATIEQGGVFYVLTGTGTPITLTTCDAATDFDTKLFVYTGSCGAYTCVGGNDDDSACGTDTENSTVTFTSVLGTRYYVFVTGWNEDTGNFALQATCSPPLAAKSATATAFEVWPNPANSGASLRVALPKATSAGVATLHNVLGQRLRLQDFAGSATELPTTGLPPGTYLLTVQAAGQAPAVRRVVVE